MNWHSEAIDAGAESLWESLSSFVSDVWDALDQPLPGHPYRERLLESRAITLGKQADPLAVPFDRARDYYLQAVELLFEHRSALNHPPGLLVLEHADGRGEGLIYPKESLASESAIEEVYWEMFKMRGFSSRSCTALPRYGKSNVPLPDAAPEAMRLIISDELGNYLRCELPLLRADDGHLRQGKWLTLDSIAPQPGDDHQRERARRLNEGDRAAWGARMALAGRFDSARNGGAAR